MDLEKVFNRVPRKVTEWSLRKKGVPEIIVRALMSLYEGGKTRVRVGSGLLEEFTVKVGVFQGSGLFAIVVDVVTEGAREGLMNEILYVDDLVLTSGTIVNLRGKFRK